MSVAKRVAEEFGCRLGEEVRVGGEGMHECAERVEAGKSHTASTLLLGWLRHSV